MKNHRAPQTGATEGNYSGELSGSASSRPLLTRHRDLRLLGRHLSQMSVQVFALSWTDCSCGASEKAHPQRVVVASGARLRFQVLKRDLVESRLERAVLRARMTPSMPARVPRGMRDVALSRGGPLDKSTRGASRLGANVLVLVLGSRVAEAL